jgi:hypothetical protein
MTEQNDEKPGYQSGHNLSRNSREGFAERTRKNLVYIEKAEERRQAFGMAQVLREPRRCLALAQCFGPASAAVS